MAAQEITVPFIQMKGYKDEAKTANIALLKTIVSKYKTQVDKISAMTNVKPEFIYAMMFVESGGNPSAGGGSYIGLMQISTVSAGDAISTEKIKGRLSKEEEALIRQYLGDARTNMYLKRANLGVAPTAGLEVTKADLLKPEFNILCGTLLLGQLMDKYTEMQKVRFEKVIWGYNRGYFSKPKGTTVEEIYTNAPTETKNYITRVGGIDGILSLFKTVKA